MKNLNYNALAKISILIGILGILMIAHINYRLEVYYGSVQDLREIVDLFPFSRNEGIMLISTQILGLLIGFVCFFKEKANLGLIGGIICIVNLLILILKF